MEFDDFGDLFGDEVLEMEEKDVEKDEIEQEKSTQKAKDLENVAIPENWGPCGKNLKNKKKGFSRVKKYAEYESELRF
ncbi:unnamed protein product [Meloidogyne enterolobii]|uniref:Uncharacterized protein n=1 Tax=Meloidogyne enterolobii TaxID=390850 RepID=A0ACB0ZVS9_MELEN